MEYEVIIVGSGISGLACAQSLRAERPLLKILVLEARDRVGGRLHFEHSADVGGGWISPSQKHCIDAAERLGLELVVQTWPKATDNRPDTNLKTIEELCECCGYAEPSLPLAAKQDLERFIAYLDELAIAIRNRFGEEPWKVTTHASSPDFFRNLDNMSLLDSIKDRIQHPDAKRAMAMICETVLAAEPRDVRTPILLKLASPCQRLGINIFCVQVSLLAFLAFLGAVGGTAAVGDGPNGAQVRQQPFLSPALIELAGRVWAGLAVQPLVQYDGCISFIIHYACHRDASPGAGRPG